MIIFTQSSRQINNPFLREVIEVGGFNGIPQELWLLRGLLSHTDFIVVIDDDGQEPSELLFDRKFLGLTRVIRITKPRCEVDIPGTLNVTMDDFTPEVLADKIHEIRKSKEFMLLNV